MKNIIDFILSKTIVETKEPYLEDKKYCQETKSRIIKNFQDLSEKYWKLKGGTGSVLQLYKDGTLPFGKELYKSVFRSQLEELVKYKQGEKLLKNVCSYMQEEEKKESEGGGERKFESPLQVVLTRRGSNKYYPASNQIILNFNRAIAVNDEKRQIKLFSVYPMIYGRTTSTTGESLVVAKDELSPYFISVFHEFNHYKDHKEFHSKEKELSIFNKEIANTRDMLTDIIKVRDYKPTDRISSIRHNVLEHRTVFDGDPSNTSELLLRMEAGEPIRYLYQPVGGGTLYEPESVMLDNATTFIADEHTKEKVKAIIKDYLDRLHHPPMVPLPIHAEQMDMQHMKTRLADSILQDNFAEYSKAMATTTDPSLVNRLKANLQIIQQRKNEGYIRSVSPMRIGKRGHAPSPLPVQSKRLFVTALPHTVNSSSSSSSRNLGILLSLAKGLRRAKSP